MTDNMIVVSDLKKSFKINRVLRNVTFTFPFVKVASLHCLAQTEQEKQQSLKSFLR